MPVIRIHLEPAEYDAVERFASGLKVSPEAVAYSALNRLMLDARDPMVKADVVQTAAAPRDNPPLWSDSAVGRHGHEGRSHENPEPSRYL